MDDDLPRTRRGVPELIAAYREGECRTELLQEAYDLRHLPDADGELPDELLDALFSPRDFETHYGDGEPDRETQISVQIAFPMVLNENKQDIPVADLAFELASYGLMSVLFVFDEHLVLILGSTGGGSMGLAHSFVFERSREYENLCKEELESTPATRFNMKSFDWHMTGTGYVEEIASQFVDEIVYIIEKRLIEKRRETIVAWSHCLPAPVDEWVSGFALDDTYEMIRDGKCSVIDDRAHALYTHVIHQLYNDIFEDFPDRFLPSGWAWSPGMDRSRLGSAITEPGFFRRQSNMARRSPHALIRALVTADRAIVPQETGKFADARLYAFLYDAIPAPVFREVAMFL